MSDASTRRRAFRFGLGAEAIAAMWLRLKGYRVLDRRFRVGAGEVDIVARSGGTLVFVEVKARTGKSDADPVRQAQLRRIAGAARGWLARHPADMSATVRFDLVTVSPWRLPHHRANAYELDLWR